MKKRICYMTVLTMLCVLTACGAGEKPGDTARNEGEISSEGSESAPLESDYLYGKITSITGNEIELSLVKMPEPEAPSQEEKKEEGNDDQAVAALPMTPALPAGEIVDDAGENMEYTGETLTLTIPAGIKFYSMGNETTLSALKKGSLISVEVDSQEDRNIRSVTILE